LFIYFSRENCESNGFMMSWNPRHGVQSSYSGIRLRFGVFLKSGNRIRAALFAKREVLSEITAWSPPHPIDIRQETVAFFRECNRKKRRRDFDSHTEHFVSIIPMARRPVCFPDFQEKWSRLVLRCILTKIRNLWKEQRTLTESEAPPFMLILNLVWCNSQQQFTKNKHFLLTSILICYHFPVNPLAWRDWEIESDCENSEWIQLSAKWQDLELIHNVEIPSEIRRRCFDRGRNGQKNW
jgi:hypothetical protein